MGPDRREPGEMAQVFRLLLVLSLWSVWLALRAVWSLLTGAGSRLGRRWAGWSVAGLALAAVILLGPHAVGFGWSWLLLRDAADAHALQAEGREPEEIAARLRRRAFALGFTDILEQPKAIQVERLEREGQPVCRVRIDFRHGLKVYRWVLPPIRVQITVEQFILPRRDPDGFGWLELSLVPTAAESTRV